jgi:hypothetical protein
MRKSKHISRERRPASRRLQHRESIESVMSRETMELADPKNHQLVMGLDDERVPFVRCTSGRCEYASRLERMLRGVWSELLASDRGDEVRGWSDGQCMEFGLAIAVGQKPTLRSERRFRCA